MLIPRQLSAMAQREGKDGPNPALFPSNGQNLTELTLYCSEWHHGFVFNKPPNWEYHNALWCQDAPPPLLDCDVISSILFDTAQVYAFCSIVWIWVEHSQKMNNLLMVCSETIFMIVKTQKKEWKMHTLGTFFKTNNRESMTYNIKSFKTLYFMLQRCTWISPKI